MTLDEMAGWHHQLDGHEFEQAPGVGAQDLVIFVPNLAQHLAYSLSQWFSAGGKLVPGRTFSSVSRRLLRHGAGEGLYRHLVGASRDATKHLTML